MKRDCEYQSSQNPRGGGIKEYQRQVTCTPYELEDLQEIQERRIYLFGEINASDREDLPLEDKMNVSMVVRLIVKFNREDAGVEIEKRKPIKIYINSPGGEVYEGFPLISAIELSKTPVYTYNVGQWSSMAFLIGITGHKRFSLPNMMFLMHDGSDFMYGSSGKVQDEAKFRERYERDVIRAHILRHSRMKETEYEILNRVEYYMLPDDALSHGFIDVVVSDIDEVI